ncbi:universal stress protein [Olivibacter sp. SDN3]|uniref:universal stress protein n=1 Tax=Olivibacter sp. SDN3 TaxID=2764720 RepID=UPI0016517F9A|nr:universal stress protein [Olivibacter sp. SDN3]QNL51760.1 universal stress protein [Olivibacter sp. SDN3]
MIKSILVPTDFSENALSALKYAAVLAEKFDCKIHIAHAYTSFHSAFQGEEVNERDRQQVESEAKEEMENFIQRSLVNDQQINITSSLFKGDLLQAIEQWVREEQADLIIMGTKGASGLREKLLGSNSFDVAKSSSVPVIVVPLEIENFKLDQITFFTNYSDLDVQVLKRLNTLFGSKESSYKLVHIHEVDDKPSNTALKMLQEWASLLGRRVGLDQLSWELVHGKQSVTLVNEIAARYHTDLIALSLAEKTFFEQLFHKSLTKAVIHQPKTPVLLVRS